MRRLLLAAALCAVGAWAQAPTVINPTDQIVTVSIPEINNNFSLLYNGKAAAADCTGQPGTVLVALGASSSTCRTLSSILGFTPVQSFNGRSGGVLPATGDYNFSMIGGTLAANQMPVTVALTSATNVWAVKQTFSSNGNTAAFGLIGTTADPSNLAQGDFWWNTSLHRPRFFDGSTSRTVMAVGDTVPWSLVTGAPPWEPAITPGLSSQYWRGDKTWQDLATAVYALIAANSPIQFVNGVISCPTCGSSAGGGISSVGLQAPTQFTVSNSPLTQNGDITLTWANAAGNLVLASPDGITGKPSFRSLLKRDLPALSSGSGLQKGDGLGFFTPASYTDVASLFSGCTGTVILIGADGLCHSLSSGSSGSVNSVDVNAPVSLFSKTGGPITDSGMISFSLVNQSAGMAFMGPASGVPGVPSFRSLVRTDMPPAVVFSDQTNTYGSGAVQDMSSARLIPPLSTVAGLPSASSSNRQVVLVIDALSATDCTVGGGSSPAWCRSNGGSWQPLAGSGAGTIANGTPGQIVVYSGPGTAVNGVTPSQDATIDTVTGKVTVTKTQNVPFAPSATVNALDAGNISAGTLPAARLGATVVQNNQSNAYNGGTQDFSSASHTIPFVVGLAANKPATCQLGEGYFASDAPAGQNLLLCAPTNTWTQAPGSIFAQLGLTNNQSGTTAFSVSNNNPIGSSEVQLYNDQAGAGHAGFGLVGSGTAIPDLFTLYNDLGSQWIRANGDIVFLTGAAPGVTKATIFEGGGLGLAYGLGPSGTPSTGTANVYVSAADKVLHIKDDAGALSNTVRPTDCSGVGHVSRLNADGSVSCSADSGGGIGGVATGSYIQSVSAATSVTITASTHGQGIHPYAGCYDNESPVHEAVCDVAIAANGDITVTWTGTAFTGSVVVWGSGGGPKAYNKAVSATTSVTIPETEHGQGTHPYAGCLDSQSPAHEAVCDVAIAANGDITVTWISAFTGSVNIWGGGPNDGASGGGGALQCNAYQINFSNSTLAATAGSQASISLFTLPANAKIAAVDIKHSISFAASNLTDATVSIGWSGSTTAYAPAFDIFQTVSNTAQYDAAGAYSATAAAHSITATFTSSGANLNTLTAGAVTINACYYQIPTATVIP